MKESSGKEEYCFMPSLWYTAECQDKADSGQQAVELPGESKQTNGLTSKKVDIRGGAAGGLW